MPIDMLKAVNAAASAVTSVTPAGAGAGKALKTGNPGSSFADVTGAIADRVTIGEDGMGEFRCNGGAVSVWVQQ